MLNYYLLVIYYYKLIKMKFKIIVLLLLTNMCMAQNSVFDLIDGNKV